MRARLRATIVSAVAPQTPCERLLQSESVSADTKKRLRAQRDALNPFALHRGLEAALRPVLQGALRSSRPTGSLHCAPLAATPCTSITVS